MAQGPREHPDVKAAVKHWKEWADSVAPLSISAVAKFHKIDRSTLSKALKRRKGKRK